MGERRQLTEQSREFRSSQILPMTDPQLDSSWMPDFPGLSDKAELPRLAARLRAR